MTSLLPASLAISLRPSTSSHWLSSPSQNPPSLPHQNPLTRHHHYRHPRTKPPTRTYETSTKASRRHSGYSFTRSSSTT